MLAKVENEALRLEVNPSLAAFPAKTAPPSSPSATPPTASTGWLGRSRYRGESMGTGGKPPGHGVDHPGRPSMPALCQAACHILANEYTARTYKAKRVSLTTTSTMIHFRTSGRIFLLQRGNQHSGVRL